MFDLLKDVIHAHKSTVIIYVIVVILISLIAMWVGRFDFLDFFIPGIPLIACVLFLPECYGRETNWHSPKATEKQIIGAKYEVFLFIAGLSFLLGLLVTASVFLGSRENIGAYVKGQSVYMGLVFLFGAIYLWLSHLLSRCSSLIILLVSILVWVCFIAIMIVLYRVISLSQSMEQVVLLALSCTVYVISYFVSLDIYKKKKQV